MNGTQRLSPERAVLWFRRNKKLSRALVILGLLAVMLFLFAFQGDPGVLSVQVSAIPSGSSVLLMEEWGELCLFASSAGNETKGSVLALDRSSGETAACYRGANGGILWAALRGDSLFVVECEDGTAFLTQLSLPDLLPTRTRLLPVAPENLSLFDCDGQGSFYFADPNYGNSLWKHTPDGLLEQVGAVTGVSFLQITPEGTLFAVSGFTCFWGPAQSPQQWQSAILSPSPLYLLGETLYVSTPFRSLCSYQEGSSVQVNTVTMPSDPLLCALDREGQLLYQVSESSLECVSLSGESQGTVSLRGTLLALCGSGAISQEDGFYWFTPVQFFQSPSPAPEPPNTPEPTPPPVPADSPDPASTPVPADTPEPTPSPETVPSPEPRPTPLPPTPEGITQEGEYLVMPMDVTLSQLLTYFAPDGVQVCRPDGTPVTEGHLATGMTVEGYTLVVLGDCDGSGTLNRQDLRTAQELLLEETLAEDPYRRAADLDGDGVLSTPDLVLLAQEISS